LINTDPGQRKALMSTLLFHFSPPNTDTQIQTERHIYTQTDRQTDTVADRKTNRQIDRQTQ